MITVRQYDDTYRQEWNEFVKQSKNGHFMHQRDYMEYHSDRFSDFSLIFLEDDRIIGVLPANIEDGVVYSHKGLTFGGVITDNQMTQPKMLAVFDALTSFCRERSLRELVYKVVPHMYHRAPAQEDIYALFRHDAELFKVECSSMIDLREPVAMAQGKRTGANKAMREGIRIVKTDNLAAFFEMVSVRLNSRYNVEATHTPEEMTLLASRFPENIVTYGAFKDDRMVAGALLFINHNVVHVQYLSSNDEGRTLRAVDYLVRHLIQEAYPQKYFFDFGNSNEQQGRYLNESLVRQKEEFGARTVVHLFYKMRFA